MERPNTVSGLQAKRKELRLQIKRLLAGIRAIDTAIALFDPDSPNRRRKRPVGDRQRFVVEYLKLAKGPVTTTEITNAWMRHQGIKLDPNERNELRRCIRNTFTRLQSSGQVKQTGTIGTAKAWVLAGH